MNISKYKTKKYELVNKLATGKPVCMTVKQIKEICGIDINDFDNTFELKDEVILSVSTDFFSDEKSVILAYEITKNDKLLFHDRYLLEDAGQMRSFWRLIIQKQLELEV
jgi:hypothetical protein